MKKIEKLDEFKRNQLEKLLDKIEDGSLELESLIKFEIFAKSLSKPKIQIIENYPPFLEIPQENLLIIKPLSSWNSGNFIGLTEIQLYDKLNQIIQILPNSITIKNASFNNMKNVKNLINGVYETIDENQMWSCNLPQFPLNLEIQINFSKEIELGGLKIWNYNKNSIEISKGVKDCEIFYNGSLKWKGIIKRGIAIESNLNYAEQIIILEAFEFSSKFTSKILENSVFSCTNNSKMQEKIDIKTKNITENNIYLRKSLSNHEIVPNHNKNMELQLIKDKIHLENECRSNKLSEIEKNFYQENNENQLSMNKFLKSLPKIPLVFEDKYTQKKGDDDLSTEKSQPIKKMSNRFDNNKEFLENYSQKSKFFEKDTENTAKKSAALNPLDTLKFFNLNNDARLIKPPNDSNEPSFSQSKENPQNIQNELDVLDSFFNKGLITPQKIPRNQLVYSEKIFKYAGFSIPTLPSGRYLSVIIYTTWGDTHYVGLSGLELYDSTGEAIKLKSSNQIKANPADINVLPEYGQDPRTIDKLMDGVYRTCDDLHVWLAPFNKGKENLIEIDLLEFQRISMIRIWNYNKSRIHSFRGVKDIEILLDNKTIFQGEIKKAPGTLKNSEKFCEYIMLTEDDKILNKIEKNDWLNNELINITLENDIDEILNLYERPKTATKFFDQKELNEIQGILELTELKQDLLGADGRPMTLAISAHSLNFDKKEINDMKISVKNSKNEPKKFVFYNKTI